MQPVCIQDVHIIHLVKYYFTPPKPDISIVWHGKNDNEVFSSIYDDI